MVYHYSPRGRFVRVHEAAILLACVIAGAVAMQMDAKIRAPLASSETRFVETSQSGLQIVPASCPSAPHFAGDSGEPNCGGPVVPVEGSCTISGSPSSITSGQSTTLSWNVYDQYFTGVGANSTPTNITITGIGAVPRSGQNVQFPTQSTVYTLSGTYTYNGSVSGSFSCSTTVIVDGEEAEEDDNLLCPAGQHASGESCVCDATNAPPVNGSCFVCPAGQHAVGNFCICNDTNMPPNTAGACTQEVCPPGFQWDPGTSQCVAVAQCSLPTICSSQTSVLNQCTGQSTNCALNGPGWFCSGGICRPPPPPVASISAIPSLVSVGATTNVAWTSQNSIACSVTGNNGDGGAGWSGTSGAHASRPIQSQTIYTLSCQGFDGSAVTRTATVNIIPGEEEPCSPGFHHENGVCVPN